MSNEISSYLGQKGYSLLKETLSVQQQIELREELVVKPNAPKSIMINVDSFPIYKESKKKFYIPKYFGITNFGFPQKIKIEKGDEINLNFKGSMRDMQIPIIEKFMKSIDNETGCGGGLIDVGCGEGKCHGFNTPILMYNGEIKMVQDIKVGDELMGDDSTPRKVLSLARGKEMMYEICPNNGDPYIVNESHILSLKCIKSYNEYEEGEFYDIELKKYLELLDIFEYVDTPLIGYRVPVDFPEKDLHINAYSIGYWLCSNELMNNIPNIFKINSKGNRLELLAGIIDYCGFIIQDKYNIILEKESLIDDIIFLSRSVGLSTFKIKTENNIFIVQIFGIVINQIPIKDINKKITICDNTDVLLSFLKINKLSVDNYYGFELDGNHRYLLGDMSVTHNTVMSLKLISEVKRKTLIIVHKSFLLNQWIERINEFLPDARIGQIQGQILDIEDKDIVIGMLQSLSMKEYPQDMFKSFGFTIVDECHHISSEVFSRSLQCIVTRVTLGLSATMERKDGLTKVFKMFLGDIIHKGVRKENHDVLVKGIEYKTDDDDFNEVKYDFRGNPAYSTMISKLCSYNRRSEFILNVLTKELEKNPNQQIMILGQFKEILIYLYKAIEHRNIASVGYYVGGMKEADLKISETKTVVIATYAMAAEGLDIKTLSTLIMVTPKTDITQSVGRILRVKHSQPLIIDIIDSHDLFKRQWLKRKAFYKKNKYTIIHTNNDLYNSDEWTTLYDSNETTNKKNKKNISKSSVDDLTQEFTGKCLIKL